MKKVLSAILVMSVATSMLAFSASAVSPDLSAMPASQLAYMDVYSASPETQQAILNARAEIIYGDQAWTVNGAVSVFDAETGETETLPEFSDVFPGWNLFEIEAAASGDPDIIASAIRLTMSGRALPGYVPSSTSDTARESDMIDFTEEGPFPLANDAYASTPFTDVTGRGNVIGVGAITDPLEGSRYNLGVFCGQSHIGWKPNLKVGQGIKFTASSGRTYSIRGSAYREEFVGQYTVRVSEDPSFYNGFIQIP